MYNKKTLNKAVPNNYGYVAHVSPLHVVEEDEFTLLARRYGLTHQSRLLTGLLVHREIQVVAFLVPESMVVIRTQDCKFSEKEQINNNKKNNQ